MTFGRTLLALSVVLSILLSGCVKSPVTPIVQEAQSAEETPKEQSGSDNKGAARRQSTNEDVALELWNRMTPKQQAASVLMLNYPGTDVAAIAVFVSQIGPAGLIVMGDGIPDDELRLPEMVSQIQAASSLPMFVAVDQEGGWVRRVRTDPTPGALELRNEVPSKTQEAFRTRAELLESFGFNTNFGIVADVTGDQGSFVYDRVLGLDAADSSPRVAAAVRGEQGRVLSVIKHFPGHGSVSGDSHSSIPTTEMSYEEWLATQAPPFQAGTNAGAQMVMMGHLRYTAVDAQPASISNQWVRILRENMRFGGVVVTDDMAMFRDSGIPEFQDAGKNAVAALTAGVDLILDLGEDGEDPLEFGQQLVNAIVTAVETGELDPGRLQDAGVKLLAVRLGLPG